MNSVKEAVKTIENLAPAHWADEEITINPTVKLHYMANDWKRLHEMLNGRELEQFIVAALIVVRQYKILCAGVDRAAKKMRDGE